jgi:2,3-dihydroxybenzoate decarboxylase
MHGKIALEEHFATEDTMEDSRRVFGEETWPELRDRLTDAHGQRLRLMDQHGIETMFLSLNAPAVQAIPDTKKAVEIARRANDFLAAETIKYPGRIQGLAALPMQDPDLAARELQRCIAELGFKGALVNGFTQVGNADNIAYYDQAEYRPFWAEVERLDVPFYLHPRNPLMKHARSFEGHAWLLGASWAFGQETAVHALRLMASGLFDDYPRLNVIVGHMGEGLPFLMWRVDHHTDWVPKPPKYPAKRKICEYFQNNFYITTSGNFRSQALINAILEVGSDRIMFSVDWPFENIDHAAGWFDATGISEADRRKIGRDNARNLFKLG